MFGIRNLIKGITKSIASREFITSFIASIKGKSSSNLHPFAGERKTKTKKKKKEIEANMSRNITYITGTQLLSFRRRPNFAIIDVRYNPQIKIPRRILGRT